MTGTRPMAATAKDWWQLTKPRLNFLVLFTAAAGFALGKGPGALGPLFWHFTAATFLLAAGSAALNMWLERDSDALMTRTRDRPLAAGRLQPTPALFFGLALSAAAIAWLALKSDPVTTGLGLATWVSYLLIYTPLKRVSSLSVLVGAVPGALPPVMGWTASGQDLLGHGALALFLLMFIWQVPHFLSIAALYQEDYLKAGIKMIAADHGPQVAARQSILYAAALIPVSLWVRGIGLAGGYYEIAAIVLGLGLVAAAAWAAYKPQRSTYRGLLLASVTYLPLLFAAMLLDKQIIHP